MIPYKIMESHQMTVVCVAKLEMVKNFVFSQDRMRKFETLKASFSEYAF